MKNKILAIITLIILGFIFYPNKSHAITTNFTCEVTGGVTSACTASPPSASYSRELHYGSIDGSGSGYGGGLTFNGLDLQSEINTLGTGDGTYYLTVCSAYYSSNTLCAESSDTLYVFQFDYISGNIVLPVGDTTTRFISITPENATTTATTTTIGATIYINEEDYDDDMYLSMSFTNQTLSMTGGSALDAWNSATGQGLEIRLPLVAGENVVSTTTTFLMEGQTHGAYSVRNPNFINQFSWIGTFWQPSVLISTTTDFVVGYKTGLDIAVEQGGASVAEYLLTGTTTGANTILNCSNLLSGGLTPCLTSIFVPNAQTLSADMQRFRDGFLSVWPLGYITRFIEITLTTGTSTLPSISYTTASSSMFGVIDIDLDPFGSLASADSPMNYQSDSLDGKTIWEIMEQPITIVVYLMLLFMILHDLTGVAKHNSHRKS